MKHLIFIFILSGILFTICFADGQSTATPVESIIQFGGDDVEAVQAVLNEIGEGEGLSDIVGSTSTALGHLSNFFDHAQSAVELYQSSQALDRNECVPDFTTNARSMMPSNCGSKPSCEQCYAQAIGNLTTIRRSLGRLSCIHSNTKSFKEAAIAFGDNVSGIHGVLGLAWQTERQGIELEFNKFKETYDKKYIELMQALERNLKTIGECENKFGMKDWYGRFGFIYFEMMKEKYKRTE